MLTLNTYLQYWWVGKDLHGNTIRFCFIEIPNNGLGLFFHYDFDWTNQQSGEMKNAMLCYSSGTENSLSTYQLRSFYDDHCWNRWYFSIVLGTNWPTQFCRAVLKDLLTYFYSGCGDIMTCSADSVLSAFIQHRWNLSVIFWSMRITWIPSFLLFKMIVSAIKPFLSWTIAYPNPAFSKSWSINLISAIAPKFEKKCPNV